jgi:hypothetical protein
MLQEFLQTKIQSNEFRVNTNVRERGAKRNTDSPTCDDTDRRSEVSNKTPRKAKIMMRSENGQTRMNGKVKRLPFDVVCKSGPTQERERENKKEERVNGSDGINRQRYVRELTKKPSLYKSYTDQERTKQNTERMIF